MILLKLTTKGRYGLRAVIDLAMYAKNEPVSLSDVAERQNISISYLEQLISKLKKAGIVQSTRGAQGGYALAKEPEEISVGEILRALEAVALGEAARQPVRELSGGMQRRVALVRALLADSPLVIMDEPFKGLDSETRTAVIHFTRRMLKGRTALIVTHDPAEAALLDAEIFELQ